MDTWLQDNVTFTSVMILVIAVLVLLGAFLIVYVIRYPSYDYPENIERSKRKRKKRGVKEGEEEGQESQITNVSSPHSTQDLQYENEGIERLQHGDGTTFRSNTTPGSLRLPTPGDAQPAGRLPPLPPRNHGAPDELILESDVESMANYSPVLSRRRASGDSAILDDVHGGRIDARWGRQEVASDIPSVG